MDLSDINKVASRKRMNAEAEKLREKMSRESSKIIKLRVAQDTAYWELKERLSGAQAEHERLQQNMLDVQMQHEALSARYQDELRLRPETLNRLTGTREICDALEEYAARVRASLRRAAADRTALAASYDAAARRVRSSHAQHTANMACAAAEADRLRQSAEHGSRLAAAADEARRGAERASEATRAQLDLAIARAEEQRVRWEDLTERLANAEQALREKERLVAELRAETERRVVEARAEEERAARIRADLQAELNSCNAALAEAEARGKAQAEEMTQLRAALAAYVDRAEQTAEETGRLIASRTNMENQAADLERKIEALGAQNNALQAEIEEKVRESQANVAREETLRREIEEILAAKNELATNLLAARNDLRAETEARAADVAKATEQQKAAGLAAAAAERELTSRADTVARLMRDVADEAEARARVEAALHTTRTDLETAMRARAGLEEDNRSRQAELREKDDELARRMTILLEMRSEKERLQDVIRSMQDTIDNVQKELTRKIPAGASQASAASAVRREPPEHDDNALSAPPTPPTKANTMFAPPPPPPPRSCVAADDLLYHFLSDSSMDADALDPNEVNARFEAMSRSSAVPIISSLKRRRDHNHQHQNTEAERDGDNISLSQVKSQLATRGRSFFRNKRSDGKPRKAK